MRSRTYSTRKLTYLPNASTLGYGKYQAASGDYITTSNGHQVGRVLGQITSCDNGGPDCRGHLVVAMLSTDLSYGYENWINPADVTTCVAPERVNNFLTAFLTASVKDTEAALQANEHTLAANDSGQLWVA